MKDYEIMYIYRPILWSKRPPPLKTSNPHFLLNYKLTSKWSAPDNETRRIIDTILLICQLNFNSCMRIFRYMQQLRVWRSNFYYHLYIGRIALIDRSHLCATNNWGQDSCIGVVEDVAGDVIPHRLGPLYAGCALLSSGLRSTHFEPTPL